MPNAKRQVSWNDTGSRTRGEPPDLGFPVRVPPAPLPMPVARSWQSPLDTLATVMKGREVERDLLLPPHPSPMPVAQPTGRGTTEPPVTRAGPPRPGLGLTEGPSLDLTPVTSLLKALVAKMDSLAPKDRGKALPAESQSPRSRFTWH